MLVQDPSCCNGALRIPDHLKLEGKFDLIIAVVSVYSFLFCFVFEVLAVQDKVMSILLFRPFRSRHFWYGKFKIAEENVN